jgi:hypothetical protein
VQFLGGFQTPELQERLAAGFPSSHAALDVFFGKKLDVGGKFVAKIVVQTPFEKQRPQTR